MGKNEYILVNVRCIGLIPPFGKGFIDLKPECISLIIRISSYMPSLLNGVSNKYRVAIRKLTYDERNPNVQEQRDINFGRLGKGLCKLPDIGSLSDGCNNLTK